MATQRTRSKVGMYTEKDKQHAIIVGQNIRNERLKLKISQVNLAKKIGISSNALQRYESGLVVIPITTLMTLAEIFDVSIESLCTDNGTSAE